MDPTGIRNDAATGKSLNEQFHSIWETLVEDILLEVDDEDGDVDKIRAEIRRLLEGTVPQGKQNRGLSVVAFNQYFDPLQTEEKKKLSLVLGWCLEILQASMLVADDIMDESETRRGLPCWYRHKDVGTRAIADAFILENALYILLNKYFSTQKYFETLLSHFGDITYKTTLGQSLDIRSSLTMNLTDFSPEHYSSIVKYKTSYYSFYMPMKCALIMNGINDEATCNATKEILLDMGHFFQVQDDFLDCFGETSITGKVGTDIQDRKCSWLIVQALRIANSEQLNILRQCYGNGSGIGQHLSTEEREAKVKEIYSQLELETMFASYEESAHDAINLQIKSLPKNVPQKPFNLLLNQIYKRVK